MVRWRGEAFWELWRVSKSDPFSSNNRLSISRTFPGTSPNNHTLPFPDFLAQTPVFNYPLIRLTEPTLWRHPHSPSSHPTISSLLFLPHPTMLWLFIITWVPCIRNTTPRLQAFRLTFFVNFSYYELNPPFHSSFENIIKTLEEKKERHNKVRGLKTKKKKKKTKHRLASCLDV